jgi:hypothetical protein
MKEQISHEQEISIFSVIRLGHLMSGMAPTDLLLSRLEGVKRTGSGYVAKCPAHHDKVASLSVGKGDDGKVLIKCFAGCEAWQIVEAAGLRMTDLFPVRQPAYSTARPVGRRQPPPVTVSELAANKKIPEEFLRQLGWIDEHGVGVRIPYSLLDGSPAPRHRRRTALVAKDGSSWFSGKGSPVPYGLHRLEDAQERGYLVLVEGETDAATLWLHGYPCLGIPGASQAKTIQADHLVGIERVYYWREPDAGGEAFSAGVEGRLTTIGFTGAVFEMQIDGIKDVSDLHRIDPAEFDQAFCKAMEKARRIGETPIPNAPVPLFTQCMADIEMKPVTWLWKDRLPLGKLAVIAGEPGLGKSRLALSIAATTSKGGYWPGNEGVCEKGEVLILNFEDDPADTTVPRLTAEDADLSAIHQLIAVPDEKGHRAFDLSRDTERLAKYLELHPRMRLVIVDPITACMGQTDSHKNAEVRAALHPLASVAQQFGVCVLAITHLNKGTGMKAMHRVTGSIAFTAAARVVFAVARDEMDPEGKRRLFVPIKNNLGNDQSGLSYGTEVVHISSEIVAPRIVWGDVVTITADEALAPPPDEERGAMEEACEFLTTLLSEGPVAAEKVKREARNAGVAPTTLKRSKRALKVKAAKTGMREGWEWSLP